METATSRDDLGERMAMKEQGVYISLQDDGYCLKGQQSLSYSEM